MWIYVALGRAVLWPVVGNLTYKNDCGIADMVIGLIMKAIIYFGDKSLFLKSQ